MTLNRTGNDIDWRWLALELAREMSMREKQARPVTSNRDEIK